MNISKKSKNLASQAFLFIVLFLSFQANAALVGKYTIDAGKAASALNYLTFSSAVSDLDSGVRHDGGTANGIGVSGPVVFKVANGTYTEQIDILPIPGTSAKNTVLFQSLGGDSSKVILTYPASYNYINNYTIEIDTASYITFSKMTIQRTGAQYYAQVIQLNQARGATFLNNQIIGPNSTNNGYNLVTVLNDTDNVLKNNYLLYGQYAIASAYGNGYILATGIDIENNIIDSFYYGGININYESQFAVVKNIIENGVSLYNNCIILEEDSAFTISKNQIFGPNGYVGIEMYYCNSSLTAPGVVSNNMISITSTNPADGIEVVYSAYNDFYYNSVLLAGGSNVTGSTGFYRYNYNNFGQMNLYDNIFINKASGLSVWIYDSVGGDLMDYNDLLTNGAYIGSWQFANQATLADWQSASSLDAHSISVTPLFKSNDNLHASSPMLIAGIPLGAVKDDIDGDTRSLTKPDIGADEFKLAANDAGVYSIDSPGLGICSGATNVYATLFNFGSNNLTSATINWAVNGTSKTAYAWTGSLSSGTGVSIKLGSFTLAASTPEPIKAWTSAPNGKTDGNTANDTISEIIESGLTGAYTIGGSSPDFNYFADAINTLNSRGLCGPVVFNVANGAYYESLTLDSVPGSSSVNTITFQSSSNDSSQVIIENSNVVLTFNSACNYIFKGLSVQNTGYSDDIDITGGSKNNTITHCLLRSGFSTYSNLVYFYTNGIPNINNAITNCALHGGGNSISAYGTYYAPFDMGLTITGNIIDSFYNNAIYTYYEYSLNISKNLIQNAADSAINAIYIYGPGGTLNVNKNKILLARGGYKGIYLYYDPNISSSSPALISNNFISIGGSLNASGFYADNDCQNFDVVFNNINVTSSNTSSAAIGNYIKYGYSYGGSNGIVYKDNNAVNTGGGVAVYVSSSYFADTLDYNNYYVPSTSSNLGYWSGSSAADLSTWQSVSGQDPNSLSVNPLYNSATDLHPNSLGIYHMGIPGYGITDDIDGIKRNVSTPSIGASEFTPVRNDAGIASIDSPAASYCAGTHNIDISIEDFGTDTLISATINWSINGVAQTAVSWTGFLTQGQTQQINIGFQNFVAGKNYTIEAYTSLPNGKADGNHNDDTVSVTRSSGLGGTFTIGGTSPDFNTFTDAVNALSRSGLCGPIVFNVRDGVYYESLTFNAVASSSAVNTITFQSQSGDSSKVILYSPYYGSEITLNGASNFIFKQFSIVDSGYAYNGNIYLNNGCTNNTITHCLVRTNSQYNSLINVYGYSYGSSVPNVNNTITGCALHGSGYSINASGNYYAPYDMQLTVTGNIIDSFYYYAVYAYNEDSLLVNNNTIQNPSNSSAAGVYIYNPSGGLNINKNKILFPAGGAVGISMDDMYYMSSSAPALVSNNFISIGGYGGSNGLYAGYGAESLDFVFNNINITTSGSSGMAINDLGSGGIDFFDNNAINTGGGYAIYVSYSYGGDTFDYNNYYVPSTSTYLGNWDGTDVANLSDWQTNSSMDANSVSVNPLYASATDLHPNALGIYHKGIPAYGVVDDIDGITRNTTTPTIGASEFTPTKDDAGILSIDSPAGGYCAGKHIVYLTLEDFGTDTLTSVSIYWSINGTAQTTLSWTGSLTQGQTQQISLSSMNFSAGSFYTIKAYTSKPNGKKDGNTNNDTLSVTRTNGLSGTFTIGGSSPDYPTFSAAVNDLNIKGVCSNVIFNVRSGVYPEDIIINSVPGSSATRTVLFQSVAGDSSAVVLEDSVNSIAPAVVYINNSSWITFKEMTIESVGYYYSYGNGVVTIAGSSNISFISNHIISSYYDAGINSYVSSGNSNIIITGNNISGGQDGISLSGDPNNSMLGLDIEGNIIDSFQSAGILGQYIDSFTIKHNLIEYNIFNYYYYGINGISVSASAANVLQKPDEISFNKVYMDSGGTAIVLNGVGNNPSNPARIYNNFVYSNGSDGIDEYGFYSYSTFTSYGTYVDIYDNNILVKGNNTYSYALNIVTNYNTGTVNIEDNNMINMGSGYSIYIDYATGIVTEDYNNLYTNGSLLGNVNYTDYSNFAGWQSGSSLDANSKNLDPKYVSNDDLHIKNGKLWMSGTPVSYIATDIDGTIRNTTSPTIGAHEYIPAPNDLGAIAVLSPVYGECGDSNTVIKVEISNFGSLSQKNVPVYTIVSGAANATFKDSVSGIGPDSNAVLTYKTFLNTYSGGLFKFKVYTVLAKDTIHANDTFYTSVFINKTSPQPTVVGNSSCSAASVKLYAYPSAGDSISWYANASGGTLLHQGDTFTTPVISKTTTYYALAAVPSHSYLFGPYSDSIGVYANASTAGIRFNVSAPIVIDSITVYPNSSGNVGVTLADSLGNPLITVYSSVSVLFPNTSVRIPVGITVAPGNNYSLTLDSSSTGGFYYDSTGATYPYSISNLVSITNTSNNKGSLGFYYGPFDLLIHTGSCHGARKAVSAIIGGPAASLSLDASSSGKYKSGTAKDPDLICAGATIIYDLMTNFSNSGFGTTWSVNTVSFQTPSGTVNSTLNTTNPGAASPAEFSFTPKASDIDSVYILKIEVKDLVKLCDTIVTRYISVSGVPKIAISPLSACIGVSQVYADSINPKGATYAWSFGDGGSSAIDSPSHTYTNAGNYNLKLTIQNASGCINTDSITITVNTLPNANFGASTVICPQQAVQFSDSSTAASGDKIAGWQYNFGDKSPFSNSQNPYHQYSGAGTDTVTLTVTTNKGCSASVTKEVKIQSGPKAGFTTNAVCVGDSTRFTNTSTVPVGTPSYLWDFGDGSSTSALKSPAHFYAAGAYTVKLAVALPGGCTDTVINIVSVNGKPTAYISAPATACVGTTVAINDSGSTGTLNYKWHFGDGDSSATAKNNHAFLAPNNYTIRLTVSATGGCPDTVSKNISINANPVANFVHDTACDGSPVHFRDTSNGTIIAYSWNFGDGAGTSSAKDPAYSYSGGGTYPVSEKVTSTFGCSNTVSIDVNVNNVPVTPFSYSADTKGMVTFSLIGTPASSNTYSWDFGDGSAADTQRNAIHTYSATGSYLVTLSTKANTGCSATDTLTVSVDITGINNMLAQNLKLQIAPNPFSDKLNIEYNLPNAQEMKLGIYDIAGKEITTFVNTYQEAGKYEYTIDADKYNIGAGVYFLRIVAGSQAIDEKLIRIR